MGDQLAVTGPVLTLRALGLGDLLCAVPALRALTAGSGGAVRGTGVAGGPCMGGGRVVLAAPGWLTPVALLSGAVSRVVPTAPLGPVTWSGPAPSLAVNLHGCGPQSTATLRALEPGRLLSYDSDGAPAWDEDEHERLRWCRLVTEGLGLPADPDDLLLDVPAVAPLVRDAVLIHPGGAAPSRRWPAERWTEVARALAQDGFDVRMTGGPDEVELAASVADRAGLPGTAVLAGETDMLSLCAVVAAARLVLSADTGLAHLATAYAVPSVVLFGPVPPTRWGPPTASPQHRALWAGPASDPFADTPAPALLQIAPVDVLQEVGALVGAHPRSGAGVVLDHLAVEDHQVVVQTDRADEDHEVVPRRAGAGDE